MIDHFGDESFQAIGCTGTGLGGPGRRQATLAGHKNNPTRQSTSLILLATTSKQAFHGLRGSVCSEQTMGQRVMGHRSSGSTNVNGSRGSRVCTVKHLNHD